MNFNIFSEIKKAARTTAIFIKRIPNVNFKSEQEIIEAYEECHQSAWIDSQYRRRRFAYYFNVFDLKESWLLDELTEKESEQYSLIWKLVDLEGGRHD